MRFDVVWKPECRRRLAEIWVDSDDKAAVAQAANAIDVALRDDPLSQGEARAGTTRILIIPPLAVVFDVLLDDCRVVVTTLRELPRTSTYSALRKEVPGAGRYD